MATETLAVVSVGAISDWGLVGAADKPAAVLTHDGDTSYLTSNAIAGVRQDLGFAAPVTLDANDLITNVTFWAVHRRTGLAVNLSPRVLVGASTSTPTPVASEAAYAAAGHSLDVQPNGTSWTFAALAEMLLRLVVPTAREVLVTHAYAVVTYEPRADGQRDGRRGYRRGFHRGWRQE